MEKGSKNLSSTRLLFFVPLLLRWVCLRQTSKFHHQALLGNGKFSAGSRPWDKGGGGERSSRPLDKGGPGRPKNFFRPFGPQFGPKLRGGGQPPRAQPLDPPLKLGSFVYSYLEKGCRKKCTRQSRKVLRVVLGSLFFAEIWNNGTRSHGHMFASAKGEQQK